MSEITMKTIETLPLVEEPAEGASLVGWNEGQTVRMPVGAVGGSKGIVITCSAADAQTLAALETTLTYSCNYSFEEFTELAMAGSPIVYVNTYDNIVSSCIFAAYSEASGSSWNIVIVTGDGQISLTYDSTGLYEQSSEE